MAFQRRALAALQTLEQHDEPDHLIGRLRRHLRRTNRCYRFDQEACRFQRWVIGA